jgi:Uma2 family endonuclease
MDGPHKRNATYADIEALPEGKVGQLIDGDLYICGRPRVRHAVAIKSIARLLDPADSDPSSRGWVILPEVEIWFGKNRKTLLVPDLAGWRRERMPEIPDVQTIDLVPDWVCEGLSPSTARIDKGRKKEIYARHRVDHVWYADPKLKMLEVFALDRGSYRAAQFGSGNDVAVFAPFTFPIDLAKLWQR